MTDIVYFISPFILVIIVLGISFIILRIIRGLGWQQDKIDEVTPTRDTRIGNVEKSGFENRYKTAKKINDILEFAAWTTMIIGLVFALLGLLTGGIFGSTYRSPPVFMRFLAMLPGLATALAGFISVAMVQHFRASTDNAEMSREMLAIARRQEHAQFGNNLHTNSIVDQSDRVKCDPAEAITSAENTSVVSDAASRSEQQPSKTSTSKKAEISVTKKWDHRGHTVVSLDNGTFALNADQKWIAFQTLEAIDDYISNLTDPA